MNITPAFRSLAALAFAALALAGSLPAHAAFPDRPIKLIVAFPPGGGVDVAARMIGERVGQIVGQPVVVENVSGAGGNIGTDRVAKSKGDGYTILFASIATGINPSLYKNMPFDPVRDLAPVSLLSTSPYVLMASANSDIRSVKDLVQRAATADGLKYASAGNGSGAHLFMELFRSAVKVSMTHVPYRGSAPAMNDVMAGQVPLVFDSIITALPLIKAGKVRALGLSTKTRSSVAPDIPTLSEVGVTGYDATSWFGIFAPATTPKDLVQLLSQTFANAVKDPQVAAKLRQVGSDPIGSDPETFGRFFGSELQKWAGVIRDSRVTLD